MSNRMIRWLVILGAISVFGIAFTQSFWALKAYNHADHEFHQTVSIALREVAIKVAKFSNSELPKQNLIQRQASNYYSVNINSPIDAAVLEDYLISSFESKSINTDFEYGVYDCFSQELVYGNYCKLTDGEEKYERSSIFPQFKDLNYYFVVKFPSRQGYILSNITQNIILSFITFLALTFFIYSTWVILQQKRLSELQKDFINNMTHEFKTPISSIKIAADVIKNKSVNLNEDRMVKYSQIILDQNKRLNNHVEKVLNLAKLENNELKLKKEKILLNKEISKAIDNALLKKPINKKVTIEKDFRQSSLTIRADEFHFSNIISNLLDNAIKYSKEEVQISVKLHEVDHWIQIGICDKGIGMTPEQLNKIFTKFYRVPSGNVHNVKGFGLGLYYVKNICDAHDWKLEVNSKIDKGSCFVISMKKDE